MSRAETVAYLVPVRRSADGKVEIRDLINNGPRLTSAQREYGWQKVGPARGLTREQWHVEVARANTLRIIALKGSTIFGTTYLEERSLDVSSNFAEHLVKTGLARWPEPVNPDPKKHDCMDNAQPYEGDGPLGHGFECAICHSLLQVG